MTLAIIEQRAGATIVQSGASVVAALTARAEAAAAAFEGSFVNGEPIPGSVNLYDYTKLTNQALTDAQGGTSASGMYRATDFIPVKANTTYIVERGIRAEYDANKNFLRGYPHTAYGPGQWPVGADTAFVRFNVEMGDNPGTGIKFDKIMMVEGTQLPASFVPYKPAGLAKRIPDLRINADQVTGLATSPTPTATAARSWAGLNAAVMGDSIVQGTSAPDLVTHFDLIKQRHGFAKMENLGIGGASLRYRSQFDASYPSFATRSATLKQDLEARGITTLHAFFLHMGVNDPGADCQLGTVTSEDPATVRGALNVGFRNITTAFPLARFLIVTPINFKELNDQSRPYSPSGGGTVTVRHVADALLEMADIWGLDSFDLHRHTPFVPFGAASRQAFFVDANMNLHPNNAGYRRLADRLDAPIAALAPTPGSA